MNLHLDFETRSLLSLEENGLTNYCRDKSTAALLLAWAIDDEEVQLWELHAGIIPTRLHQALRDSAVRKVAWNSQFEYNVLKWVLKIPVPIEQFIDPMSWARHLSLPGSLEKVGRLLDLDAEMQKMEDAQPLKDLFCYPASLGGEKTLFGITEPFFHDWNTRPREWEQLKSYCKQDVVAEREIFRRMQSMPLPESEQRGWVLDQEINERGLPVNREFVRTGLAMVTRERNEKLIVLKEKTQLENPNSRDQMLAWIKTQGYPYNSLGKWYVEAALNRPELTDLGRDILRLRQETSKTSYKKLAVIDKMVSDDNRLRYQFQYLGAARTGRWSSYGAQVQNQTKPTKAVEKDYDRAVGYVMAGNLQAIQREFGSCITTVTSCLRSAFQAPEGSIFDICDLNAIENRVLGWVSGCRYILNVFREGKEPYLDFATKVRREFDYEVAYAAYLAGEGWAKELRKFGKPATLGAGFGLGGGEMQPSKFGDMRRTGLWGYAEQNGVDISQEDAHLSVTVFRELCPEVAGKEGFWKQTERAAKWVIANGGEIPVGPVIFGRRIRRNKSAILRIKLPSGRYLHYFNARLIDKPYIYEGEEIPSTAILYDGIGHGVGAIENNQKWGDVFIYGGKFTENIVQAIARDVLLNGMLLFDEIGGRTIGTFHDEILAERRLDSLDPCLDELRACMMTSPKWARDLPLGAEGFSTKVYRKG